MVKYDNKPYFLWFGTIIEGLLSLDLSKFSIVSNEKIYAT